jgi:stress-induced morphogen
VLVVLFVSSLLISNDIERLIIAPLSAMSAVVRNMSLQPLQRDNDSKVQDKELHYELKIVSSALTKLGRLIQVRTFYFYKSIEFKMFITDS